MKSNQLKITVAAAMVASLYLFTSCSSEPKGSTSSSAPPPPAGTDPNGSMKTTKGVPGGSMVQTHTVTATVKAVDPATRHITLESADGRSRVIKAGPEIANFNQIRVGDKVKATVTEQLVVFLREGGSGQGSGSQETSIAVAPAGQKPGAVIADTIELSAKVVALDTKTRHATLQFADGTTHTVSVRPDVDMSKAKLGDDVVIRSTEELAIKVEKP
jgi:hypothetical protein